MPDRDKHLTTHPELADGSMQHIHPALALVCRGKRIHLWMADTQTQSGHKQRLKPSKVKVISEFGCIYVYLPCCSKTYPFWKQLSTYTV